MSLKLREIALFAMYGALIFVSKLVLEMLPNVHLIGVFVVVLTVVYRSKALYPIYIFVFMLGLYNGFSLWWFPYLYLWTVLWGAVMLLPKNMPKEIAPAVYMIVCALHGVLYGTLYAPAQAIMFGLNFEKMCIWILNGLPWDLVHGTSNFICGILIIPLVKAIRRADRNAV
ncbi:MAG: hypothetical protein E7593_01345 [Ruminococcaceae bacterium]|nr:hypothetical protein [Oscillospiraceae bacterium]